MKKINNEINKKIKKEKVINSVTSNEKVKNTSMSKLKLLIIVAISIVIILIILTLLYFIFFHKNNKNIPSTSNSNNNVSDSTDNSNLNQDYDVAEAIKNITITSNITLENSLIVIAKNNNNFNLYNITIEVNFYDKNNKIIDTSNSTIDFIANNSEYVLDFCCLLKNLDHYDFNITVVKKNDEMDFEHYNSNDIISNIKNVNITNVVANLEDEVIDFNIYNNSDRKIDYINVAILYYLDDKIIGFDSVLEVDLESKKNKNSYFTLPYDANDNFAKYTSYKIIVNEASTYNI